MTSTQPDRTYDASAWADRVAGPLRDWSASGLASGFTGRSVLSSLPVVMPSEAFRHAAERDAATNPSENEDETRRRAEFVDEVCAILAAEQVTSVKRHFENAALGRVADKVVGVVGIGIIAGVLFVRGPMDAYSAMAVAGLVVHVTAVHLLWRSMLRRATNAFEGSLRNVRMPWNEQGSTARS